MNTTAIELVIFKIKSGINDEVFKAAAEKTTPILQKMDGFLSREISFTSDGGYWVDIVHWRDMESAQKAAKAFGKESECQDFITMIDSQDLKMLHLNSVLTTA